MGSASGEAAALTALAAELAGDLAARSQPIDTTLRELRDTRLAGRRLTRPRRLDLQRALEAAGLVVSIPLEHAGLDQPLEIERAKADRHSAPKGFLRHPAVRFTRWAVTALVGALGTIAAMIAIAPFIWKDGPPRMSGDLNLIAAGFTSDDENDGEGLARSLTRSLQRALPPTRRPDAPELQFHGPDQVAAPTGPDMASDLARQVDATVVVYGRIVKREDRTLVIPRIYVDPARLTGAEELGGDYALPPIDAGYLPVNSAVAARTRLRSAVVEHVRGLSAFTFGLGWFSAGEWRQAARAFGAARRSWPDKREAAMVSLFEGNAAGKLGRIGRAKRDFERALSLNPEFERARLGLTEVGLHAAQRSCGRRANRLGLLTTRRRFLEIGSRAIGLELASRALRVRALLGAGRADLCLSQSGLVPRWGEAIASFRAVAREASPDHNRFRSELAEAHGGIGLALLPVSRTAGGAQDAYRRAKRQYSLALTLTDDVDREAVFAEMLSFINSRLRDERQ